MEREEIRNRALQIKNKADLLVLLNAIKRDEMLASGNVAYYLPFTRQQINYYCNPNHIFHRFKQFKIAKKSGGERVISAPYNNTYMLLLTYLNEILKSCYTPSDFATGFVEQRSVVDNASRHIGQNYVLNIDLKDFFPSIEKKRVWGRLLVKPFQFSPQVANLFAGLCTMKVVSEMPDGTKNERFVLPQGAPTSPLITNMICDNLDRSLGRLAKRFNLNYSRYADDITFSSMHYVYSKTGDFWKGLNRIVSDQGFTLNEKKTRLQKKGDRQEVTGLVVSNKINVTKEYVRNLRNLLFIWDKYGLQAANSKFLPRYKSEKGHVKKGIPSIVNVLDGKLMYLKMVKGDNDSVYMRLRQKFDELVSGSVTASNTSCCGVSFVEKFPLLEFENKYSEIHFCKGLKNNRYGYYEIDGNKVYLSVSKNIADECLLMKDKLMVSSCLSKNKSFWLVHLADKKTTFADKEIDVDLLNSELDELINAS